MRLQSEFLRETNPREPFINSIQVLLPSPRNPASTNLSLMQQTNCTKLLHASEVAPVVKALMGSSSGLNCLEVSSFEEILVSEPPTYPYQVDFADVENDPIVILHSSGSTGK